MNRLKREKQEQIIGALVEGASIRNSFTTSIWFFIPYVPELVGMEIYAQFFGLRRDFVGSPPFNSSVALKFTVTP